VAPVIVAADADLDDALPRLMKAGFYHAGQVCVSVQRVYAHRDIARKLADRMADAAGKLTVGDPTDAATDVGPLIRHDEIDRVHAWVQEAIEQGAQALCGGKPIQPASAGGSPTCYEPTVLFDPPDDSKVMAHEVFGPVVSVCPFDDMDEALARANDTPFAFQASVFTRDLDTALRASRRLDASAVMVNQHTAFRVDWMPFAGLKHSGYGIGGIPFTMEDMQVEKMTVIRSGEL
jgi:acyl-CoA reductase-like NAD-dependent aldehyde dehydrogenase